MPAKNGDSDVNSNFADGENDICMIQVAGKGISFNSTNQIIDRVADHIIRDGSLKPVLRVAE
jgi:hydroxymethylpyrimidine pyrophosphatase-like HAD family hydrolase